MYFDVQKGNYFQRQVYIGIIWNSNYCLRRGHKRKKEKGKHIEKKQGYKVNGKRLSKQKTTRSGLKIDLRDRLDYTIEQWWYLWGNISRLNINRGVERGRVYLSSGRLLGDRLQLHFVGCRKGKGYRRGGESDYRGRGRGRLGADERRRAILEARLAGEGVARVCTGDGRGQMTRANNLERVRDGVAVLVHLVVAVRERDAETLVGHCRREAAGARPAIGHKAMRETVARPKDGRGGRE